VRWRIEPGRRCLALLAALVILAASAGADSCGESERSGATIPGSQLVIYTSLPLQGVPRQRALDVLAAERRFPVIG